MVTMNKRNFTPIKDVMHLLPHFSRYSVTLSPIVSFLTSFSFVVTISSIGRFCLVSDDERKNSEKMHLN